MTASRIPATILAVSIIAGTAAPVGANPSGIFQNLSGAWRGSGKISLADGKYQRISCRAYYTIRNSGAGLGLAIRCASPGSKIELRAKLRDSNGLLSGTWEERTFNATGNVSGRARSGSVNLAINGSISGSMRISYNGGNQTVSVSTATEGLKGISINLRR